MRLTITPYLLTLITARDVTSYSSSGARRTTATLTLRAYNAMATRDRAFSLLYNRVEVVGSDALHCSISQGMLTRLTTLRRHERGWFNARLRLSSCPDPNIIRNQTQVVTPATDSKLKANFSAAKLLCRPSSCPSLDVQSQHRDCFPVLALGRLSTRPQSL